MKKRFRHTTSHKMKGDVIHLVSMLFLSAIVLFLLVVSNAERFGLTGKVISGLFGESPSSSVSINFSDDVGIVRDDFYGANVHSFLTDGQKVDANSDGVSEVNSDLDWNRQAWLDSRMKYMRWDMNLESYYLYDALDNLNFENWTNTNIGFFDSNTEAGAVGWKVSAYGGGSGFASQSQDAHSGGYSLNVLCNKSSHLHFYKNF